MARSSSLPPKVSSLNVKTAVFPREEVGGFAGAEVFAVAEHLDEAVSEELIQGHPTALHPCGARHPLRG